MFKQIQISIGFAGLVAVTGLSLPPHATAQIQQTDRLMAQASAELTGSWRLVDVGDPTAPAVIPQTTELTAEFTEDGRIFGSGGCNRFMGGYQTQDGNLVVSELASSLMACEETVSEQEARYLAALQGAQQYEIDDQGLLTIFYETEQELGVLHFVADTATSQTTTPPAPQANPRTPPQTAPSQTTTTQTQTTQTTTTQTEPQTVRGLW